jgi:magnesium chelatase family protein
VDVEVDISSGLPSFATVGLPHGAVREGRERIGAALANAGYAFPLRRITVNLAPADIQKTGSGLDLPIALGVLVASGQDPLAFAGRHLIGEAHCHIEVLLSLEIRLAGREIAECESRIFLDRLIEQRARVFEVLSLLAAKFEKRDSLFRAGQRHFGGLRKDRGYRDR